MREQIESLQEKLDALLGGSSSTAPKKKLGRPTGKGGRPKGKRTMSAAGRASIAAAQKARWAKINGKAAPAETLVKAAPKKKVMSPEAKAKIAATMKARWDAKKKGVRTE